MIVSTQTDILSQRFGYEKALNILADVGYDAIDFSLFAMLNDDNIFNSADYLSEAHRLRAVLDGRGIRCNQAHAPFPSSRGEETYDTMIFDRIVRSMEIASVLGARQIIVHPKQHLYYVRNVERLKEINRAFYTSLLPYCKKYNIRVAVENMFQQDPNRRVLIESTCARPAEFCEYVDMLDPEWFVACLDIGHCGLIGQDAAEAIRLLGHDRLHALHVHDNDYMRDLHTLPYQSQLKWDEILGALADIRYDGEFTLEADNFLTRLPPDLLPAGARFMCETARSMAKRLEDLMASSDSAV